MKTVVDNDTVAVSIFFTCSRTMNMRTCMMMSATAQSTTPGPRRSEQQHLRFEIIFRAFQK